MLCSRRLPAALGLAVISAVAYDWWTDTRSLQSIGFAPRPAAAGLGEGDGGGPPASQQQQPAASPEPATAPEPTIAPEPAAAPPRPTAALPSQQATLAATPAVGTPAAGQLTPLDHKRRVERWTQKRTSWWSPKKYSWSLAWRADEEALAEATAYCAELAAARPRPAEPPQYRGKYGFYLHDYAQPRAVLHQLESLRTHFPTEPVYLMSDGGLNFSKACDKYNCKFQYCRGANDRWNPAPFLYRIKEATRWLDTEYVIMLEPDNTVHGPITHPPTCDAGGLRDQNVPLQHVELLEAMGQKNSGNPQYFMPWRRFGLAGGSYFRASAVLDAFDPAIIADWQPWGARGKSSDVAMALLLAAKGYCYYPWEDIKQVTKSPWMNATAFQHHGAEEGHKPFYGGALGPEHLHLVSDGEMHRAAPVTSRGDVKKGYC